LTIGSIFTDNSRDTVTNELTRKDICRLFDNRCGIRINSHEEFEPLTESHVGSSGNINIYRRSTCKAAKHAPDSMFLMVFFSILLLSIYTDDEKQWDLWHLEWVQNDIYRPTSGLINT
jgi:hypothetical protein